MLGMPRMTPTLQRLIEWAGGHAGYIGIVDVCLSRDEVEDADVLVESLALGDVGEDKQAMDGRKRRDENCIRIRT